MPRKPLHSRPRFNPPRRHQHCERADVGEELIIADHSLAHPGGTSTLTLRSVTQSRPPRHRLFGRMLLETHVTSDSRQVIKLFRGHGFVIAPRSSRSGESRGIRRIQKSPDRIDGPFFFLAALIRGCDKLFGTCIGNEVKGTDYLFIYITYRGTRSPSRVARPHGTDLGPDAYETRNHLFKRRVYRYAVLYMCSAYAGATA